MNTRLAPFAHDLAYAMAPPIGGSLADLRGNTKPVALASGVTPGYGPRGPGLSFSGTQTYPSQNTGFVPNPTNGLTILFTAMSTVAGGSTYPCWASAGIGGVTNGNSTNDMRLCYYSTEANTVIQVGGANFTTSSKRYPQACDGNYHRWGFVFLPAGGVSICVDGVVSETLAAGNSSDILGAITSLYVGTNCANQYLKGYFTGFMSDIQIWQTILTPQQISLDAGNPRRIFVPQNPNLATAPPVPIVNLPHARSTTWRGGATHVTYSGQRRRSR